MRIVIVNSTTDLYGANRILSRAILGFPSNCEIEVWLPTLEGPFPEILKAEHRSIQLKEVPELPIIQRKMFSPGGVVELISLLIGFRRILKRENSKQKIDLLYVNTLSNFFVLPVSKYLGIRSLLHVHEILDQPKWIGGFFSKYCVYFADHTLCVSGAVVAGLKKWSSRRLDYRITCLHNGIADLYKPKEQIAGDGRVCITLIARIKPEKGIWYFLEALEVMGYKERITVRIVGGPAPFGQHHVDRLQEDIALIPANIAYFPFVNDVSHFLNETDILVVPSIMKDPFPTTVLEGMACQKAVVATDTGGATEAIDHMHSGILISSTDVISFAAYLDQLVIDTTLRSKLGKNARAVFLAKFHESVFQRNLLNYFSAILKTQ